MSKNPNELSYVVRTVQKGSVRFKTYKKLVLLILIVGINIAFLAGVVNLLSKSGINTENIREFGSNLDTQVKDVTSQIATGFPKIDKNGLSLFSTEFEEFPDNSSPQDGLDPEMQEILENLDSLQEQTNLPGLKNTNWEVFATGDFNKDQQTDLVWHNPTDQLLAVWFLRDGQIFDIHTLPYISQNNWLPVDSNDYNQDGDWDIIWRQENKQDRDVFLVWQMNGITIDSESFLEIDLTNLNNWELVGSHDFDGNKVPDLVFHYFGSETDYKGANIISLLEFKNSKIQLREDKTQDWLPWRLEKAATGQLTYDLETVKDINDDGFGDLVWRKNKYFLGEENQGEIEIWLMKDTEEMGILELPENKNLDWEINFLDLNQDQTIDLLWRNLNQGETEDCRGSHSAWIMSKVKRFEFSILEKEEACI